MSNLKLCQGPKCHTYYTKDRLKGIKGSKTYQTRRRSNFYYGNNNFCDQRCMYDWINKYINTLYSIVNKLEQRISSLEKVLASHAKCIGEMREEKKDDI